MIISIYNKIHKLEDELHLKSWFRDQVLHPHESLHSLEEVLNIFEKNWIGYGIGISQINEDFIINFEYGLSRNSFENGKLHLKWVTRL